MTLARYVVGTVGEIQPGERKITDVKGRSIGIFNVAGTYYALLNRCPHQGGPLCLGATMGTTLPSRPGEFLYGREGEILRCPWHGWEFDLTNGRSVYDPNGCRVRAYDVTVEPVVDDDAPRVETFDVTVENNNVVLHI